MSYSVTTTGNITITPALTWREIQASPLRDDLDIEARITETDDGTITVRTASAVGGYQTFELADRINAAIADHPDRVFAGEILCQGDDAYDLWRIAIVEGRAVTQRPTITWP